MPMNSSSYEKLARFAAVTAFAVLSAAPAFAAEAEHSGGLPQLRTEFWMGQLFWLVICFGVTYLLMSRIAIPAVQSAQEKRMRILRADLDAAAVASEQAKALQAQYEKALTDSRAKAQAAYSDMNAAIAKETAAQQASLQTQLSQRIGEAEKRIAEARNAAMKDVETAAKDLAGSIVESVTGQKAGAAR